MTNPEQRKLGAHATSRFVHILLLLAVSAWVSACGGRDEGFACTTEARTSVLLTVLDQLGAPLPGVTVMYRVDAGNAQSQACEADGTCPIAFEVSGVFSLTATKPGYTSASATVTVTRDECHVNTERLTLTLRPAAQSSVSKPVAALAQVGQHRLDDGQVPAMQRPALGR